MGGGVVRNCVRNSVVSELLDSGATPNNDILIPIDTLMELTGENDYSAFFASAASLDTVEETAEKMDKRLARNFGVSKRDMDDKDAKPCDNHIDRTSGDDRRLG